MHLMYFTEQPMSAYPEDAVDDDGVTALMFSNSNFDPVAGSQLYNDRLVEYQLVEEVGFDGIMLNEHHNAPFCMQAQITVWASILAAATERVKIVLLGTPLPTIENPVAISESLSMIDMISKGRLVAGIVRGAGTEQFANNVNPAFNRDRFYEAHELLVKTWTEPGPWRWEGDHYQLRVVNPWALPLQKPHPRIWVPGVASPETIVWCAENRYPYICLNTTIEQTKQIWQLYEDTAQETGYTSGPEHRGYLIRVHVQDTEEHALEKRPPVHVDAGRVHRPRPRRLVGAHRVQLAHEPRGRREARQLADCIHAPRDAVRAPARRTCRSLRARPTRSSRSCACSSRRRGPASWRCGATTGT